MALCDQIDRQRARWDTGAYTDRCAVANVVRLSSLSSLASFRRGRRISRLCGGGRLRGFSHCSHRPALGYGARSSGYPTAAGRGTTAGRHTHVHPCSRGCEARACLGHGVMASRQRAAVATADFAATAATRDYSSIGRREGVGSISRGHRGTSKRMGTARGCQVGSKRASPPPVPPHERVGRPRPLTQDHTQELSYK